MRIYACASLCFLLAVGICETRGTAREREREREGEGHRDRDRDTHTLTRRQTGNITQRDVFAGTCLSLHSCGLTKDGYMHAYIHTYM